MIPFALVRAADSLSTQFAAQEFIKNGTPKEDIYKHEQNPFHMGSMRLWYGGKKLAGATRTAVIEAALFGTMFFDASLGNFYTIAGVFAAINNTRLGLRARRERLNR